MKTKIIRRFFLIIWTILHLFWGCVSHLWGVNCCCRMWLAQSWPLFFLGYMWVTWMDLITWIVVSHLMIVYQEEIFAYSEGSIYIYRFKAFVVSMLCPVNDQKPGSHNSDEIGIAWWLRKQTVQRWRYVKRLVFEQHRIHSIGRIWYENF